MKAALWPLQRRALSRADLLHATSDVECAQIRAQGFTAPIAIVPNGIDLPSLPKTESIGDTRTLLFLSRIHPTKAIDRLLHAWRGLQDSHPDWRLVIAGDGESEHVREVKELAQSMRLLRVDFPGPLYGAIKTEAYHHADLFVLPTHSENFGMVVAEALAHACPVVVSRGAPWSGVTDAGCGWWVSNDSAEMTTALDIAMRLSAGQRARMGLAGREWMMREFSWTSVASRMELAYEWLLRGGIQPSFVKDER